jgi:hypothetical protein
VSPKNRRPPVTVFDRAVTSAHMDCDQILAEIRVVVATLKNFKPVPLGRIGDTLDLIY